MVFASLFFLYVFLPLNLLVYFLVPKRVHRDIVLVLFSFIFYAWGEPIWLTLLLASSTIDCAVGRAIERAKTPTRKKLALTVSLVSNLGLLATFKYAGFVVGTVNSLTGLQFGLPSFALPIGISFYTFQTISYVVDVYRGQVAAQHSYLKFMLFVSLYHQLVAGPIVRYSEIAEQIENRVVRANRFAHGFSRFCIGLFKKVYFANLAGELVTRYMDADPSVLSVGEAWVGLLAFSLQIYFDFSGYSDMAIGLGMMFGFRYLENFDHPYISRSVSEFWRRWHISLGTFFKDYVYIPLGGNRRHVIRNLLVVWGLTGLWHGASWNFCLWGLYFGVLIVLEKLWLGRWLERAPRVVSHVYLLTAVILGWSLFYFTDFAELSAYLQLLFGQTDAGLWTDDLTRTLSERMFWIVASLAACAPIRSIFATWWHGKTEHLRGGTWLNVGLRTAVNIALLAISTALLVGSTYNPFLYFRF